jgi:hypothetical protein
MDPAELAVQELLGGLPSSGQQASSAPASGADAAVQELLSAQPQGRSALEDYAMATTAGLGRGAAMVAGAPGTILDMGAKGLEWLARKGYSAITGDDTDDWDNTFLDARGDNPLSAAAMLETQRQQTGGASDYKGERLGAQYAGTIAEFLPAATIGGGGLKAALQYGVAPAITSETAGQIARKVAPDYEPAARAVTALATPFAIEGAKRLITPSPARSKEYLQFADDLEAEGVPVSAGQRTGNRDLMRREGMHNPEAAQHFQEVQDRAFTRAVLKRIGVNADAASPDVLEGAAKAIGQQFDDLTARNSLPVTRDLVKDLRNLQLEYASTSAANDRIGAVNNVINEVIARGKKVGALDGRYFQNTLSQLRRQARNLTYSNPNASHALDEIATTLDEAMQQSLVNAGSADAEKWTAAREAWKNLRVIENAVVRPGQRNQFGTITPQALRSALTRTMRDKTKYARGNAGGLENLARAGNGVLYPINSSGTAENLRQSFSMLKRMASGSNVAGTGVGGAAGSYIGGPIGGGIGAIAGNILGGMTDDALGSFRFSDTGRRLIGNQLFPDASLSAPLRNPFYAAPAYGQLEEQY